MYLDKEIKPREGLNEQMLKRKEAVKMLLESIPGENAEREGLIETPKRVANMYEEIFGGYEMDPHEILSKSFSVDSMHEDEMDEEDRYDVYNSGLVIVKDIPFYSHCEHHMVPFFGHVHIAYIPSDKVVGLSKLARLVECYARRLQIQERLTNQIADTIIKEMDPLGVLVVIKAEHLCMAMRGVKKPGANTVTSSVHGVFEEDMAARAEVMNLFGF